MQSPDESKGYITAMDDLLNEFFQEPMTPSSPEYIRVPLLSYMLAVGRTRDILNYFTSLQF